MTLDIIIAALWPLLCLAAILYAHFHPDNSPPLGGNANDPLIHIAPSLSSLLANAEERTRTWRFVALCLAVLAFLRSCQP